MARPQKDGLDYFPHDTDASSDPKVEPLILLYNSEGYAFYFLHLEYIYKASGFELEVSDAETRQIFCKKLGINEEKYQLILNSAIKHKCFNKNYYESTGKLTSNGIKKRAAIVLEKRDKMRAAYESKKSKIVSAAETHPETPQSKVKKRKEKKSKVYINKQVEEVERAREGEVFQFFNQNISPITPFQSEAICKYLDDGLETDLIIEILKDSLGKREKWSWANKVLNNSSLCGIKTLLQYQAKKEEHKDADIDKKNKFQSGNVFERVMRERGKL